MQRLRTRRSAADRLYFACIAAARWPGGAGARRADAAPSDAPSRAG
jgi:hypothetical protein